MIPWQIYCDFLEDKGLDTRLLRSLEPSQILLFSVDDVYINFNQYQYAGEGYGDSDGEGRGDGWLYHYGGYLDGGNGHGYGPPIGNIKGDSSNLDI